MTIGADLHRHVRRHRTRLGAPVPRSRSSSGAVGVALAVLLFTARSPRSVRDPAATSKGSLSHDPSSPSSAEATPASPPRSAPANSIPTVDVTVVVADAYPNFSICGIPYYFSGEVQPWQSLAHRTHADLEATGMRLRLDTLATSIDVAGRRLDRPRPRPGSSRHRLRRTHRRHRRTPLPRRHRRPRSARARRRRPRHPLDGRHLRPGPAPRPTRQPRTAIIIGAGYVGLEMAEAFTARGMSVTQLQRGPEVLSTLDPELGALVHTELADHGVESCTDTTVDAVEKTGAGLVVTGTHDGQAVHAHRRPRPRRRRRPPQHRASSKRAGADPRRGPRGRRRRADAHRPARTSWPPATASSRTTASSASPTCPSAPPRTSRAASPARTRSAATRGSPGPSAPRS